MLKKKVGTIIVSISSYSLFFIICYYKFLDKNMSLNFFVHFESNLEL